jgi:hypothetical protein
MTFNDLLHLRDEAIKNTLLARIPEEHREASERLLEEAFTEGSEYWLEQQLPILVGESDRSSILNEEVPLAA